MIKWFGAILLMLLMISIQVEAETCKELEDKCWNKCTDISSNAVKENCKGNGYSGCALDIIGCRGHFCDYVYVQKWFNISGYKDCTDPAISEYYNCVEYCNPKFRARTSYGEGLEILRECPKKCNEDFDTKWLECKNKACNSDCQRQGSSGGKWVRYSGKLGWDSCECEGIPVPLVPTQEEINEFENKPLEKDKPEVVDIGTVEESLKKEDDGIDNASKELNAVVDYIKRLKEEGVGDVEIAMQVNNIVKNRIEPINNYWIYPLNWFKDIFLGSYRAIDDWRTLESLQYDMVAIWAWNNRMGQCEEISATVYYILKNAGLDADIYAQSPGDHAWVIMNMNARNSLSDSRTWIDYVDTPVIIVDAWQKKVFGAADVYNNYNMMDGGKSNIVKTTSSYIPKEGYEDIKKRNIVWDDKNKQWRCRYGFKREMIKEGGKEIFSHCIPI